MSFHDKVTWAPIALRLLSCTFKFKLNPLIVGRDGVLIHKQRTTLVGFDYVECSSIPEIGKGYGSAVVRVGDTDRLSNVDKLACTVIEPHVFLLITGEASSIHGGPIFRIADDCRVAPCDLGEVIPVAPLAIERNIAVRDVEIERAVVVQIAKLRSKAPPTESRLLHIARQVFVLGCVTFRSILRHPQIVPLNERTIFRNVGDIDGIFALIKDVAE